MITSPSYVVPAALDPGHARYYSCDFPIIPQRLAIAPHHCDVRCAAKYLIAQLIAKTLGRGQRDNKRGHPRCDSENCN